MNSPMLSNPFSVSEPDLSVFPGSDNQGRFNISELVAPLVTTEDVPLCLPEKAFYRQCLLSFDDTIVNPHILSLLPERVATELKRSVCSRQAEYIAARYCAAVCMSGLNYPEKWVVTDEHRCPVWPDGLSGSLSHSKQYAVAIVGRSDMYQSMGVDIEHYFSDALCQKIHSKVNPQSTAIHPLMSVARQTTIVFSAKESLFKALFPIYRKAMGFSDAQCVEWDLEKGLCRLMLSSDFSVGKKCYDVEFFCSEFTVMTRLVIENEKSRRLQAESP